MKKIKLDVLIKDLTEYSKEYPDDFLVYGFLKIEHKNDFYVILEFPTEDVCVDIKKDDVSELN